MYKARVRIIYPLNQGRIVLRTEQDWDRDVVADQVSDEGTHYEFQLSHDRPYLEFKPCIRDGDVFAWSVGSNKLLLLAGTGARDYYPFFYSGFQGTMTTPIDIPSRKLGRNLRFRVYLPAGYDENHLKRYPVLYMHDGSNLFLREEAFMGREWQLDESLDLLDSMNIIDQMIVVGIYARDRFFEYTRPGYESYGQALVEELKPWIDDRFRTLDDPAHTSVMGSSLGGVVSFFLAWEWPHVFTNAGCLSSTFSFQDDLIDRVLQDPLDSRLALKIYLDSGWPGDNYEVTLSMANALVERGFTFGRNIQHFAFPWAVHDEAAWAARVHLPIQLFSGKVKKAAEFRDKNRQGTK